MNALKKQQPKRQEHLPNRAVCKGAEQGEPSRWRKTEIYKTPILTPDP